MSTTPKVTMIGLYNWDNKLFDEMTLPPEIEKDLFINSFLLSYGEYPVVYANWDIMKFAIGVWSKKWHHSIERIIRAMLEDYDPLHNFDRHEEYTDVEDKSGNTSEKRSTSDTLNEDIERTLNTTDSENSAQTDEREVSAYNEDSYQPDSKNTADTNRNQNINTDEEQNRRATNNGTEESAGTSAEDRKLVHSGHLYGNIGVTKSTEMLLEEKALRANNNIIDIVAEMLFKEVCIFVI